MYTPTIATYIEFSYQLKEKNDANHTLEVVLPVTSNYTQGFST